MRGTCATCAHKSGGNTLLLSNPPQPGPCYCSKFKHPVRLDDWCVDYEAEPVVKLSAYRPMEHRHKEDAR